jgi:glycosyltransferase involved in cell wall biosynthesis
MRILKVTQAYHPFQSRGGPALKVRSIARELVRQGHQVTVLTADLGFGPAEIAATAAFRNGHGWSSDLDGVECVYLATQGHYRNLTVNAGVISFCRRRLRQFDVVHIYGLYDTLGPVVARYCRQFGVPYVVEPLGMTNPIDRGFALKRAWHRLVDPYLSAARKMIVTSEQERSDLLAEGFPCERLVLRYNGIDLEEFSQLPPPGAFRTKLGPREEQRFILFLGRLIPRKGADLLIQALPSTGDGVRLVIAGPEGEPGYIALLAAKASELRVSSRVTFTGPLFGEEKLSALADAFVFALPSRYENFGNSAAEALASGTPVLVSDQCGIAPLVDGRAGVVTAYDSAAVSRGLNKLLEDDAFYRKMKNGCADVAAELSWQDLVRGMICFYGDVRAQFVRRLVPALSSGAGVLDA